MKTFMALLSLLLILPACSGTGNKKQNPAPQPTRPVGDNEKGLRKRVVVLPFLDASIPLDPKLKERSRKVLIAGINQTPDMIAIDASELATDFAPFIKDGKYDLIALAKKAEPIGIHAILDAHVVNVKMYNSADEVGVFRKMQSNLEVEVGIRFIAARNAKSLLETTAKLDTSQESTRVAESKNDDKNVEAKAQEVERLIGEALVSLIPRMIEAMDKLVWEGRVAMVQGERVFLNVGKLSGLNIGDILKVSDEGEDVFDPQTGSLIGKVPGRLKGTLEVISYFGADGAIALVHSGSGFKENDRVELY